MTRQRGQFAIDLQGTQRERLPNGFLRVTGNKLTKAQVRPYLGKEIKGSDAMGWPQEGPVGIYCPAEELEKALPHYNMIPFLDGHHDFDAGAPPKDKIIGTTGSDAVLNNGFVENSLMVWDDAIAKEIEEGKDALSCGYLYDIEVGDGEFNGVPYKATMRNIRPEHLARVEKGRAGSEVKVADADVPGHNFHGNQETGGFGAAKGAGMTTTVPEKKHENRKPGFSEGHDIAKREGVSPKEGESKYGEVRFADPKNKKYPINTPKHVRAALSYWGMPKNRAKYSKEDQSAIGARIHAAAKKFGIASTKSSDSAGNHKEIAMAKAKHTLSPLAYRVAGALEGHLRSTLAKDAAINPSEVLKLADHLTPQKFVKQIDGLVGSVNTAFDGVDTAKLRSLLLDMAAECEDEDEDGEEMGEDEKKAKEAEDAKKAKEAEDKAKSKDAKKDDEDEEEKEGMDEKIKKAADAAFKIAREEAKALRQAEKDVAPLVGEVDGLDSADAVYRYALKQRGHDASAIKETAALRAMVQMLTATPGVTQSVARDASLEGRTCRFDLSHLSHRPA